MIIALSNLESHPPVLILKGEVDATSAFQLDQAIADQIRHHDDDLILDCRNLTYISSAGLGVLLSHLRELEATRRRIVVSHLNSSVLDIFQALGLDEYLVIKESFEEAILVVADRKRNEN